MAALAAPLEYSGVPQEKPSPALAGRRRARLARGEDHRREGCRPMADVRVGHTRKHIVRTPLKAAICRRKGLEGPFALPSLSEKALVGVRRDVVAGFFAVHRGARTARDTAH